MGELDKSALETGARAQTFEYLFYDNCNCLVELDEEPPHPMNEEALKIGLEIASHLKSNPVNEVHIMRKIVIDGSNTSGFQRSAIIALGGKIESTKGDVHITSIAIEEESAGIVERKDRRTIYSLDRLGVPLVEITTEPDIKDAEHLKEIAEKIGLILRATGKVMRGIGTIRQDVNISIESGARVEIKGAQDLKLLPLLVNNEVKRQLALLNIISELKKRFNGKFIFKGKILDVSTIFENTSAKLLKTGLESGAQIFALKLEKHAGIIGLEINPNKRYGTEFSDYAKTSGVNGIIHSDEDPGKYGITGKEIGALHKFLAMKNEDSFILVVANENIAKKALEKVLERACMDCIPEETRKANPDGTTSYMRPLSGKARLYPETDIPFIKITPEFLQLVAQGASEGFEVKREKLLKILTMGMAERILRSKHFALFEKLVDGGVEPMLAASTLEDTLVMLKREGISIDKSSIISLFSVYKKAKFTKAAIPEILREMAKGKDVEKILDDKQLRKITGDELKRIIEENKGNFSQIMARYRLRVDAKEVLESINAI